MLMASASMAPLCSEPTAAARHNRCRLPIELCCRACAGQAPYASSKPPRAKKAILGRDAAGLLCARERRNVRLMRVGWKMWLSNNAT